MQQETDAPEQTPRDAAALALARGCSHTEAATLAGCHRTSITRWQREPDFREQVAAHRREVLTQATSRLGDRVVKAIDTLTALLESETEGVKLQAARALLHTLLPLNLQANIEARLLALEGNSE